MTDLGNVRARESLEEHHGLIVAPQHELRLRPGRGHELRRVVLHALHVLERRGFLLVGRPQGGQ